MNKRLHLAATFELADEAPLAHLSTAHDLIPALLEVRVNVWATASDTTCGGHEDE